MKNISNLLLTFINHSTRIKWFKNLSRRGLQFHLCPIGLYFTRICVVNSNAGVQFKFKGTSKAYLRAPMHNLQSHKTFFL